MPATLADGYANSNCAQQFLRQTTSGCAYRGDDLMVRQHLEAECQFELRANVLETGL